MKGLKMAIALFAALSALLLAGAGSASATVLCKKVVEICGTNKWGAGTELAASASATEESVSFKTTEGVLIAECTEAALAGKTSNAGSEFERVKVTMSSWTWSCSETITTVANGEMAISAGNVNGLGSAVLSGFEITINPSIPCIYGSKNEAFLGGIVGGEVTATLSVGAALKKTGGSALCVPEVRWNGEYAFSSPLPLWVTHS